MILDKLNGGTDKNTKKAWLFVIIKNIFETFIEMTVSITHASIMPGNSWFRQLI